MVCAPLEAHVSNIKCKSKKMVYNASFHTSLDKWQTVSVRQIWMGQRTGDRAESFL